MMNIINDNNKSVVVKRNDTALFNKQDNNKMQTKNEQTSEHNLVTQHRTQQDHRL